VRRSIIAEPLVQGSETVAILLPLLTRRKERFATLKVAFVRLACCASGPQQPNLSVEGRKGVLMSDCLHCDIREMLDVHLQNEQADLGEIAARVTEVLAVLILLAPPDEQTVLLAASWRTSEGWFLKKAKKLTQTVPAVQATKKPSEFLSPLLRNLSRRSRLRRRCFTGRQKPKGGK
jgi:hypothetical protein